MAVLAELESHVAELLACRKCSGMHAPPVSGGAVASRVLLVGQAPGDKEPVLQRPFAWTAGKTLFGWFEAHCAISERQFRDRVYMAAVCRCFPGKNPKGGDRVPDSVEMENCSAWLKREFQLLRPELVVPVGKLAIGRFFEITKLVDIVGSVIESEYAGVVADFIPLPHPSGASTWHRMEPGKTLTARALAQIGKHPAFRKLLE